jgi:hypothetical protein
MFQFILLATLTQALFASHLEQVCESALSSPTVWEDNLVAYRDQGETLITSHEGSIITSTPESIKGLIQDNISIWALTSTTLVELNSAGEVLESYEIASSQDPTGHARSMVKADRNLVIARGYGGYMAFNMDERKIIWSNSLENEDSGYGAGISFDGNNLYAAVATRIEKGFTGIMKIDPSNGKVLKKSMYDVARSGVISTDAKVKILGDKIILNNGGWIHITLKNQIEEGKKIRPRWLAEVVPQSGEVSRHYLTLEGEFLFHGDFIMGCGAYTAFENGTYTRKTKLVHIKIPEKI